MRLLIATRNQHKIQEIRSILGNGFEYLSLADFPEAPEVSEDADTFEGNARKKAVSVAKWLIERGSAEISRFPPRVLEQVEVLADDSGLEVDALGGTPGVLSARFAGNHGDSAANNRKLLDLLKHVAPEKRTARFRCVIAMASSLRRSDDPDVVIVSGTCEGRIIDGSRGAHGFGYDPLFVPTGYTQTFAELGADVKNKISHRARALEQVKQIAWGRKE